jgi:hypothetical protein
LPHSDIHGSTPARGSPWLFAACHVLHRLLVPRHPPNALLLLTATRTPNRSSAFPSCTGTIQPALATCRTYPQPYAAFPAPPRETTVPSQRTRHQAHPVSHASEHLRLRGAGPLAQSPSGQTCNRRVQTRQTLIHMSKEQDTASPQTVRRPANIRTTIARPPANGLRSMLARSLFPPRRQSPYGGGRYRTDDPLLAKQVLSH